MIDIFSMKLYGGINIAGTMTVDNLRNEEFRGVYLSSRNAISYQNLQHSRQPKILKTRKHMQMLPMSLLLRKHSCLKRSFDHQVSAFQSSGLIEHWEEIFPESCRDIEDKKPKKLKVGQIVGVIEVCAVLYLISLIVFFLELMTLKHGKIKKIIDFFAFD